MVATLLGIFFPTTAGYASYISGTATIVFDTSFGIDRINPIVFGTLSSKRGAIYFITPKEETNFLRATRGGRIVDSSRAQRGEIVFKPQRRDRTVFVRMDIESISTDDFSFHSPLCAYVGRLYRCTKGGDAITVNAQDNTIYLGLVMFVYNTMERDRTLKLPLVIILT